MSSIPLEQLERSVMEMLTEYSDLATEDLKNAVKKSSKLVKKEIEANAPRKSGKYAKSWTTKTLTNNSNALSIVVYSKKRYVISHLLEHGHAKRGGGRVQGQPHISIAEQKGIQLLEEEIVRSLSG